MSVTWQVYALEANPEAARLARLAVAQVPRRRSLHPWPICWCSGALGLLSFHGPNARCNRDGEWFPWAEKRSAGKATLIDFIFLHWLSKNTMCSLSLIRYLYAMRAVSKVRGIAPGTIEIIEGFSTLIDLPEKVTRGSST